MSIISKISSSIGKLLLVGVLMCAFGVGMAGVVYMSLSGSEITVPDITGKDFVESEKELAGLGLKIKRRADRASNEKINTVLEQLPKAGETVKTGQMILVVVSKVGSEGEVPPPVIPSTEKDDSEKIEEMISDKPKRPKANTNSNVNKKKADTTRDSLGDETNSNTSTDPKAVPDTKKDAEKKDGQKGDPADKNKAGDIPVPAKPQPSPNRNRPPVTSRSPSGDQRP